MLKYILPHILLVIFISSTKSSTGRVKDIKTINREKIVVHNQNLNAAQKQVYVKKLDNLEEETIAKATEVLQRKGNSKKNRR
ncbi:MAG: hypothetical protein AAF380_00570 [Bacteroidota bacterium]